MLLPGVVPFAAGYVIKDVCPGQGQVFFLVVLPLGVFIWINLRSDLGSGQLHVLLGSSARIKVMLGTIPGPVDLEASFLVV